MVIGYTICNGVNTTVLISQCNERLASSSFSLDVEIKREVPAKGPHLSPLPTTPRNRSERPPGERRLAAGKYNLAQCTVLAEESRFLQLCQATLHAIFPLHVVREKRVKLVTITSHRCGLGTGNEASVAVNCKVDFSRTETNLVCESTTPSQQSCR